MKEKRLLKALLLTNEFTASTVVSDSVGRTLTVDSAQWQCVLHQAQLVRGTHVRRVTRVNTPSVDTRQLAATVRVRLTLYLDRCPMVLT